MQVRLPGPSPRPSPGLGFPAASPRSTPVHGGWSSARRKDSFREGRVSLPSCSPETSVRSPPSDPAAPGRKSGLNGCVLHGRRAAGCVVISFVRECVCVRTRALASGSSGPADSHWLSVHGVLPKSRGCTDGSYSLLHFLLGLPDPGINPSLLLCRRFFYHCAAVEAPVLDPQTPGQEHSLVSVKFWIWGAGDIADVS